MKFLIPAILMAGLVLAEPEAPVQNPNNGGPYPPSGWKPSGRLLLLPARQQAVQVYGPPPPEYGAPSSTEADPATTDYPVTTPQQEESAKLTSFNTFNFEQQKQLPGVEHGVYHVLLPDGRLQRVEYTTAALKVVQPEANAQPAESDEQNKYQVDQYDQTQNGKFQQGQFDQSSFSQQSSQQSQGSSTYQQPQFAQIQFQPNFPATFPQPALVEIPQAQQQNSRYQQQAQFGFGSFQQSQSQQSQNSKVQQNKAQVKSQYPQQPEYDQNASQDQFSQKKYNNKQQTQSTNNKQASASESSQYNSAQQPEYQPVYLAQQQSAEQAPAFNGYVANVQYKDVEPISPPIYTYNPAPLVRILRKIE